MDQAHRDGRNPSAGDGGEAGIHVRPTAGNIENVDHDIRVWRVRLLNESLHETDDLDWPELVAYKRDRTAIVVNRQGHDGWARGDYLAGVRVSTGPNLDG